MKKFISKCMVFVVLALSMNLMQLNSFAESQYPYNEVGIKYNLIQSKGFSIQSNSAWKELTSENDISLDKAWTVVFSDDVNYSNIDGMVIEKENKFIPVTISLLNNKATVTPVEAYEEDSDYFIKVFLSNGNKYIKKFHTITNGTNPDPDPNPVIGEANLNDYVNYERYLEVTTDSSKLNIHGKTYEYGIYNSEDVHYYSISFDSLNGNFQRLNFKVGVDGIGVIEVLVYDEETDLLLKREVLDQYDGMQDVEVNVSDVNKLIIKIESADYDKKPQIVIAEPKLSKLEKNDHPINSAEELSLLKFLSDEYNVYDTIDKDLLSVGNNIYKYGIYAFNPNHYYDYVEFNNLNKKYHRIKCDIGMSGIGTGEVYFYDEETNLLLKKIMIDEDDGIKEAEVNISEVTELKITVKVENGNEDSKLIIGDPYVYKNENADNPVYSDTEISLLKFIASGGYETYQTIDADLLSIGNLKANHGLYIKFNTYGNSRNFFEGLAGKYNTLSFDLVVKGKGECGFIIEDQDNDKEIRKGIISENMGVKHYDIDISGLNNILVKLYRESGDENREVVFGNPVLK